jgi:ligand-binding sensor domain-containing protein
VSYSAAPKIRWVPILQFLGGFGMVSLIGWLGLRLWPKPDPPPGWKVIRPPQDVMALAFYRDAIWSGGRDGLYRLDPQSGDILEKIDVPLNFSGITALETDPAGRVLWIGHQAGLTRFNGSTWQTYTHADGLPDDQVLALEYTSSGDLWIGTPGGAARFSLGNWKIYGPEDGLTSLAVSVIYQDSQGRVWFGDGFTTTGGLTVYDGTWQTITSKGHLVHPVVNAILEDRQGRLWFGTGFSSQGGVSSYDGASWNLLSQENRLAGAKTRSLFEDKHGGLWFGSEYDGIALNDGQSWRVFTPKEGLAGWEVKSMLQDSKENLWFGTENGLTRLSSQVWQDLYTVP